MRRAVLAALVATAGCDAAVEQGLSARLPEAFEAPVGCAPRVVSADADGGRSWAGTLSAAGCHRTGVPGAGVEPVAGAISYDVRVPLWSDGADKARELFLPEGGRIAFSPDRAWGLPDGAVLAKHFTLGGRLVETRLMVREGARWVGASYRWREDLSDADLVLDGATADVGGQPWTFPSATDCDLCHTRASGQVLGVMTEQLNRPHDMFGLGPVNQIDALEALGLFSAAPDRATFAPPLAPLDDEAASIAYRARSWLASNCAGCHQPGGAAHTDIDLRMSRSLAETGLCRPAQTSYGLPPGSPGVAPGDPDGSVLPHLLTLQGVGVMPPLGVAHPDLEAEALIRAWIAGLDACE